MVAFNPRVIRKMLGWGELLGNHRAFVDSSSIVGGATAVWNAGNMIDAHVREYEGKPSDYALMVCFRHLSTPYGYDDAI